MNLEEITNRIEIARMVDTAYHLVNALIELTNADDNISPKALDDDRETVYEILRKHDTAAGVLYALQDITAKLDAMT